MEYKLIEHCRRGYIATRKPETILGELRITFTGAPKDATAIFENDSGESLYRRLYDNSCAVPAAFCRGTVKVTVAVLNGSKAPKYACEGMFCAATKSGLVVVPDGIDTVQEIIRLSVILDEKDKQLSVLIKEHNALVERIDKLVEGYDVD